MLSERLNIYEYEQVLLGNIKDFQASYNPEKDGKRQKLQTNGNIWRYAITKILGWTPHEARKYLTWDIVNMLRLPFKGVEKPDQNPDYDWTYMLQFAFPEVFHYDIRENAIAEWEHAAHVGKWINDHSEYQWPKNFYGGQDGIDRASAILIHAVNLYLSDKTLVEQYMHFARERKGKRWLVGKALDRPLRLIYKKPIEYFHYSLSFKNRDDFFYNFAIVNEEYEKVIREEANKKKHSKRSNPSDD